jgi:hypothetical protein
MPLFAHNSTLRAPRIRLVKLMEGHSRMHELSLSDTTFKSSCIENVPIHIRHQRIKLTQPSEETLGLHLS